MTGPFEVEGSAGAAIGFDTNGDHTGTPVAAVDVETSSVAPIQVSEVGEAAAEAKGLVSGAKSLLPEPEDPFAHVRGNQPPIGQPRPVTEVDGISSETGGPATAPGGVPWDDTSG
jgi:hypothetical protein